MPEIEGEAPFNIDFVVMLAAQKDPGAMAEASNAVTQSKLLCAASLLRQQIRWQYLQAWLQRGAAGCKSRVSELIELNKTLVESTIYSRTLRMPCYQDVLEAAARPGSRQQAGHRV